jgi:hypothetical protein
MPLLMPSHVPIVYPVTVLVHETVPLFVALHVHVAPFATHLDTVNLFGTWRCSCRRLCPGKQFKGRQHEAQKHRNEQDTPEGGKAPPGPHSLLYGPAGTAGPYRFSSKAPPIQPVKIHCDLLLPLC